MTVRRTRTDHTTNDADRCRICHRPLPPSTAKRTRYYCTTACSQIAYRRRQSAQRIEDAAARRRDEENNHSLQWTRYLKGRAGISGHQADRVYKALVDVGQLRTLPFEQEPMF